MTTGSILLALAVLGYVAWSAAAVVRARGRGGERAYTAVLGALCAALAIYAGNCLLWGVNFWTDSFQDRSGITAQAGDDLSFTMDFDNDLGSGQSVALSVTSLPEGWEGVFTGNGGQISHVFVRDGENTGLATFELSIPDDAADGTYTVGLLATGESGATDTLTLELQLTAGETGTSSFEAQYPEQEGSASTAFSFDATLVNNSASQQTYTFSTNAPTGWTVTYQPTGETTQVASLAVDARSSQGVTVNVTPPATAEAGSYDISCSAVSANDTLSTDLSVVITGTYDLVLSTPSSLLSADAQAGKDTDITLTLTNNGNTDLQNINLTSTTPDGWAVEFSESTVELLEAGATKEVTATVSASEDALSGDYVVSISASNSETNDGAEFRISVETSTLWGAVGIVLLLCVAGGLYWVFRKYGRR